MIRFSRSISLALAAILALTPAYTAESVAQGQTCGQIVDAFNGHTQSLIAEADQKNIEFLHKEMLQGDYKARWEQLQQTRQMLNDAYLCLAPNSPCLSRARERLTDKVKEWFDSLTESTGLNGARDRVLEAMNLIQTYTDRVLKISTDTMTAMQQCTAPMPGQPRLNANSVPPAAMVDAEGLPVVAEPPSKPVETPQAVTSGGGNGGSGGGGGGAGKILGVVAGVGGAVAGVMLYQQTQQETADLLNSISNSPTSNTTNPNPGTPSGVRAYDGTYDFEFVRTFPGGQETVRVPRYLIINNGRLTTAENTINGTVGSDGVVNAVGICPINSEQADWRGRMSSNGTGSGTYSCRLGGISRTWSANNRR